MRALLLDLLVSSGFLADQVAIQLAGAPVIITDSATASSNAVVTPAPDGWSVTFDPIYSSLFYLETLEMVQDFSVP